MRKIFTKLSDKESSRKVLRGAGNHLVWKIKIKVAKFFMMTFASLSASYFFLAQTLRNKNTDTLCTLQFSSQSLLGGKKK